MRRSLTALLALAALALVPASAGAMIQIQRGIAGARLNNTPAQVRAALGKPKRVIKKTNFFGPYTQYRYFGGITVTFQGRRNVTDVATTGLGDRTARGIGVGSTEQALKNRVPGVHCLAGVPRICLVGQLLPGRRVTDFRIRGGKVTSVSVGFVID
jgi:hypothetical protein